jgi:hypothetical protein
MLGASSWLCSLHSRSKPGWLVFAERCRGLLKHLPSRAQPRIRGVHWNAQARSDRNHSLAVNLRHDEDGSLVVIELLQRDLQQLQLTLRVGGTLRILLRRRASHELVAGTHEGPDLPLPAVRGRGT